MKLFKAVSVGAFMFGAAALAFPSQGCGGSDTNEGNNEGGPGDQTGRVPPSKPSAGPSDTPARTFAVNRLFLGETDRNGGPLKDAWKDYGYNLDGLITAKDSKDVCTRQAGADSAKQEDGKEGIDNAFGRTVLGFILGLVPTPSKTLNDSIADGSFTIMLDLKGLTDDPKQTNTGLSGNLYVGGDYGDNKKPTFALDDDWPYRASPIVPINDAFINEGTFVNGSGGATIELSLLIQGVSLSLNINRAIITFKHNPQANELTEGTIAGVIGTEALVQGIEKVAGRISTQLCGGSTLDTIKQTIRQASDILQDGSNKAGAQCDAISIGLGFTAKRIGPPKTVAQEGTIPPDPCTNPPADAGTD
ncbi:MAG: hypothetical protein KF819_07975 [Labilithrix sp.]|nr:hypothetical protein [Labilithrix sp.]